MLDVEEMYAANRVDPSTDPCETPHRHCNDWRTVTMWTHASRTNCTRSVRYDLMHVHRTSELQSCTQVELIIRSAQLYQKHAADRSKATNNILCPSSILPYMSFNISCNCTAVHFRSNGDGDNFYADCNTLKLWDPAMYPRILSLYRALQRSSNLFRGFASRNLLLMPKAFVTYIRPVLEYNSILCSPKLSLSYWFNWIRSAWIHKTHYIFSISTIFQST